MEATTTGRRGRWFPAGVAALVVAAASTRFHRLAEWPLFGDEFFTLADSTQFSFSWLHRPLLFWLNHRLVEPLMALDEFGLRLLPAVFGVVGVAVLAEAGRRTMNGRAGLWAGLLAVLSPWHLAWSQMARYYTLVFVLAAVTPAALYLGVRERSRGWLAVGAAGAVVAWLAHPTAILPTAGFVVWLAGYAVARSRGRRRRWFMAAVALMAVAGLAAAWAMLSQWTSLEQEWGIGGVSVALSWAVRLSAGPALAAAGGIVLLWTDGRRELASFLACAVTVPIVLMAALGEVVAVHTGFLFATAPYAFLAAGAFLDRVIRTTQGGTARRVAVGVCAAGLVVATGLPSFLSHYVDGGRPDFREAARHVAARVGPGDVVLADQRGPFNYYTASLDARPLDRDRSRLDSIHRAATTSRPSGDLWVVPYIRSRGGFELEGLGKARRWVRRHCRLSLRVAPVRIDHQRDIAEVWRCGSERADASEGGTDRAGGAGGSDDGSPDGRAEAPDGGGAPPSGGSAERDVAAASQEREDTS